MAGLAQQHGGGFHRVYVIIDHQGAEGNRQRFHGQGWRTDAQYERIVYDKRCIYASSWMVASEQEVRQPRRGPSPTGGAVKRNKRTEPLSARCGPMQQEGPF